MKFVSPTPFALLVLAGILPAAQAETAGGKVRTTAYTHTESDHLEYGKKTASGTTLKHSKGYSSAAADWSKFPLGTKFKIKGMDTTFVVDDYGSALVGTETIDIYQPSRSAMNHWGVRHVDINVIEKGDFEKSREILADRKGHSHVRQMLAGIDQQKKSDGSGSGWFFRNRKDKPAPGAASVQPATPKPAAPVKEAAMQIASASPPPKAPVKPASVPAKPAPAPAAVVADATVRVPDPAPAPVSAPVERKVRPLETIQLASADQTESAALISVPAPLAEPRKRAFRPL